MVCFLRCTLKKIGISWKRYLLSLIFLLTILQRSFVRSRSGKLASQSSTVMPWSANQVLVVLAQWAGAKSCWKRKSASSYRIEMRISFSSRTRNWFADYGITVRDWLANSPDLNLIESLQGIARRKVRDTRSNNTDELKTAIKATWASITPQQCHRLIASMPRCIDAVIHAHTCQRVEKCSLDVRFLTGHI